MTDEEWEEYGHVWGKDNETTQDHLGSAIACYLTSVRRKDRQADLENIDRWLLAIRPLSGWREERLNNGGDTVRYHYHDDVYLLHGIAKP